ncbi:hypothetical protein CH373_18510 [Leptospira perolatii]|uniref:Uncharacterized protein n=1 Tax=Leptospira perolatii TaxID=2023191 RepID=A0A2M9ZHT5_9LEPT|nr:hypothetical protein [Leptospira perolatii]PJZ68001.1 hypothetical protein CH360_18485 [Leptospira perolatii]PJZ71626.1 hypothetical protein CH373_18510 [Leptospira perolatii]
MIFARIFHFGERNWKAFLGVFLCASGLILPFTQFLSLSKGIDSREIRSSALVVSHWEALEDSYEAETFAFPGLSGKPEALVTENLASRTEKSEMQVEGVFVAPFEKDWEDPIVTSIRLGIVESNLQFYYGFGLDLMQMRPEDPFSRFGGTLVVLPGFILVRSGSSLKEKKASGSKFLFSVFRGDVSPNVRFALHFNEVHLNRKMTRYFARRTHGDPDLRGTILL